MSREMGYRFVTDRSHMNHEVDYTWVAYESWDRS